MTLLLFIFCVFVCLQLFLLLTRRTTTEALKIGQLNYPDPLSEVSATPFSDCSIDNCCYDLKLARNHRAQESCVKYLSQGYVNENAGLGIELTTLRLKVQCANHYATPPLIYLFYFYYFLEKTLLARRLHPPPFRNLTVRHCAFTCKFAVAA